MFMQLAGEGWRENYDRIQLGLGGLFYINFFDFIQATMQALKQVTGSSRELIIGMIPGDGIGRVVLPVRSNPYINQLSHTGLMLQVSCFPRQLSVS